MLESKLGAFSIHWISLLRVFCVSLFLCIFTCHFLIHTPPLRHGHGLMKTGTAKMLNKHPSSWYKTPSTLLNLQAFTNSTILTMKVCRLLRRHSWLSTTTANPPHPYFLPVVTYSLVTANLRGMCHTLSYFCPMKNAVPVREVIHLLLRSHFSSVFPHCPPTAFQMSKPISHSSIIPEHWFEKEQLYYHNAVLYGHLSSRVCVPIELVIPSLMLNLRILSMKTRQLSHNTFDEECTSLTVKINIPLVKN